MKISNLSVRLAIASSIVFLHACGGGGGGDTAVVAGQTFKIEPGATATADMIKAMVTVVPGDTIEFDCGFFDLKTTLQLSNTENITIKGCGRDKTILSFKNSNQQVGILAVNVRGITVQDLTVADTDGNGFEMRAVDHGTLERVRAFWSSNGGRESATPIKAGDKYAEVMAIKCTDPATLNPNVPENSGGDISSPDYTVSDKAGRYGIYPVGSDNILIDGSESIGASDAGIYVGQSNTVIIRNSRAIYNVFGFEIENVQGGEYHDNIAECNTGGFLVYDLDGNLRQYGDRTRMYHNLARMNNGYNFTEGGFVANVPPGSGMITLAYDRIDIFENEFRDNNTGGIIHTSYAIFPPGDQPSEKRIDFYSEGVHIWKNKFFNNGNRLPDATTDDLQSNKTARLLPAIVGYKNQAACGIATNAATCAAAGSGGPGSGSRTSSGYRGGHIVWDGLEDSLNDTCEYPKRADGSPVPADERGKPLLTNQENPGCRYNAYKFAKTGDKARIKPDWWFSCIDDDNEYSADSLAFSNFHGTKGANGFIAVSSGNPPTPEQVAESREFPATFDMSDHKCAAKYGKNLPPLPAIIIPPFVPSPPGDVAPTAEEIARLCEAVTAAGKVNFDAARVNCPTLDQYHLFSKPQDPTSAPNSSDPGGAGDTNVVGTPFVLNTKLFSDYSVKYRVLFMPTGGKAIYKDASTDGPDATVIFPVGTIIAKSFAFANEGAGTENVVETRLLIKRINNSSHSTRWDPLVYVWGTESGQRVARLSQGGAAADVTWSYHDADSGVMHTGSTNYQVPNANQCLSCHSRQDSEAGAAPIGLKVRNLNRPYQSESPVPTEQAANAIKDKNQVDWLCSHGLMLDCPALTVNPTTKIANVERLPVYNKPGDGGDTAGSAADVEKRAKAYLEVNCQHCHNVHGFAASTGLYLSASDPVGLSYGVCKHSTATGADGSGGRAYDIVPAAPAQSIVEYRISSAATSPAARMPPLARSVVHDEGHDLVLQWIRDVIVADESKYPNSTHCN